VLRFDDRHVRQGRRQPRHQRIDAERLALDFERIRCDQHAVRLGAPTDGVRLMEPFRLQR
jgi:hypothetical protein